jgi:hypothetical protein
VRRRLAALAVVSTYPLWAYTNPVSADASSTIVDPNDRYQISVLSPWNRPDERPVWYRAESKQILTITRIDGPVLVARRDRPEFFAAIERGIRARAPNYRRKHKRLGQASNVPTLDLVFEYRDPEGTRMEVAMRFLFFRSYAMTAAVSGPYRDARPRRHSTGRLLESFRPYLPTEGSPTWPGRPGQTSITNSPW